MSKKDEYIIVKTSILEDGSEWYEHLFSFSTKEEAQQLIDYVQSSAIYDHRLHVVVRRGKRTYELDEEAVDE